MKVATKSVFTGCDDLSKIRGRATEKQMFGCLSLV